MRLIDVPGLPGQSVAELRQAWQGIWERNGSPAWRNVAGLILRLLDRIEELEGERK